MEGDKRPATAHARVEPAASRPAHATHAPRRGHAAEFPRRFRRSRASGTDLEEDLAYVEMMVGEHDAAIRRPAYLLTIPSDVSVPILRADPMWDPLRSNPRFQQLLATPTR